MKRVSQGFTVIEILFVVALLGTASIIFFVQKNNLEVASRDQARKTAINAIYYSLEEVYHAQHSSYPRAIESATLPSVDPDLLTDTAGHAIGTAESTYRYEPTNCDGDACASYTLRTTLENEADYIKTNR